MLGKKQKPNESGGASHRHSRLVSQNKTNLLSRLLSKLTALLSCTAVVAIANSNVAIAQTATPRASSQIFNAQGKLVGTASFIQLASGVKVNLQVQNLNRGEHMVHLHENGKCDAPDFKSAGNHFDPKPSSMHNTHDHGEMHHKHETTKPAETKHKPTGDLPDIMVKSDGKGALTAILPELTLGTGKNSLLKQGGTAIVIHAGANGKSTIPNVDYKTRIACGVIKPSTTTTNP